MINFDEKKLFAPVPPDPCEKPRFFGEPNPRHGWMTMPEKVDDTARRLNETLERLKMFERDLWAKVEDARSIMTQDNVVFKELVETAIRDFIASVKSEVNLFETSIQGTLKLFEDSTNTQLSEQMERIEAAEYYMKTNLDATVEALLRVMEGNGSLVGVIESDVLMNVKRFGAMGDGVTDDTQAIVSALAALSNGGTLFFPNGVYCTSSDIHIPSNITLKGDTKSVIQRIPNNLDEYAVFAVTDAENVVFESLLITGERENHGGVTGEWGMGISFNGAKNCRVSNCTISKCWGDGIYVGSEGSIGCENIEIINNLIDNNRRNGVSIINVNGLRVADCRISNTAGTAPQHGICFECNEDSEAVKNAFVHNCIFTNNKYGIGFSGSANVYEVIVENCVFNGNNGVFVCRTMVDEVGGFIIVRNSVFNGAMGVVFDAKTPSGIPVTFDNCTFNTTNIGVRIGYTELDIETVLGGINIINSHFSRWSETQFPVVIRTGINSAATYDQININGKIDGNTHSSVFISSMNTGKVEVSNGLIPRKTLTNDTSITATNGLYTKADVNVASGPKVITLSESVPYGWEIDFRLTGGNSYGATFTLADGIFAQVSDSCNSITAQGIYTNVKIRHESANRWSFTRITNE